jgi:cell division protein FtsL
VSAMSPSTNRRGQPLLSVPAIPARRLWPRSGAASPPPVAPTIPPRSPAPPRHRPLRAGRVRLIRQSEPFLLMAVACALIALLATLYLTEDNKAALMTYQINDLQDQQSALLRTQGDLKLQLEQLESLQRVQVQAAAQGMVPVQPTTTTYIELPPAVDTVAPPPAPAQARP